MVEFFLVFIFTVATFYLCGDFLLDGTDNPSDVTFCQCCCFTASAVACWVIWLFGAPLWMYAISVAPAVGYQIWYSYPKK
jgi:hypothetical protein